MDGKIQPKIERAKELLSTVRHAAMATVNEEGSPHNTPYYFIRSPDLKYLYWGSHPNSQHSRNVVRTGQIFVVLYDAMERGGLYIQADNAHVTEGDELQRSLQAHNVRRAAEDKPPLPLSYYTSASPQRMYMATTRMFWTVNSERDASGLTIRDYRIEIPRESLL
jgi:hypothetical protein